MFRFKSAPDASPKKYYRFAGLRVSSNARKLEAALVGLEGAKPGAAVVLIKSASFDLPPEIPELFAEIRRDLRVEQTENGSKGARKASDADATSTLLKTTKARSMTTAICEEAISELLSETGVERDDLVAVALDAPGFWTRPTDWEPRPTFCGIGDGAALAEKTGLNVVDDFLPRDGGNKGHGSPVFALPYWILLGNSDSDRLLIDVGETARWTYVPSANFDKKSWTRVRFDDVAPCGSLLSALAVQATKGESSCDVGGRLSVQGRCLPELLAAWRDALRQARAEADVLPAQYATSPFSSVPNERFFLDQIGRIERPDAQKWSSLDALCTATRWIAEEIDESVRANAGSFAESFDVVLTGAAKGNGLLFNRLTTLFEPNRFKSLDDVGFVEDSFDAVAIATLGVLFAAGIPASLPELSGAKRETLLGRVSPGAPDHWKRFWQFRIS